MCVFAVALGAKVSRDVDAASYFQNEPRARFMALSGVKKAQAMLSADKNDFDSPGELAPGKGALGEGAFSFEVVDEERKVNINTVSHDVLERLFLAVGGLDEDAAHTAANSAIDWRDTDSVPLEGGAEDGYYGKLERPYKAKDRRFEAAEELLFVKGLDDAAFLRLKDSVTVFGDGRINMNTATADSMRAFGMSDELIERIMKFREGPDGKPGTVDDNVLKNQANISKELVFGAGLNIEDADKIAELSTKNMLSVVSRNFTIVSEGRIGRRSHKITCVTDRGNNIEYWRE